MTKRHLILVLTSILVISIESSPIKPPRKSVYSIMNEMMVEIIDKCTTDLTEMLVVDTSRERTALRALSALQSSVHTPLRVLSGSRIRERFEVITRKGIIIVSTSDLPWPTIHAVINQMRCYIRCEIFLITKYRNACKYHETLFPHLQLKDANTVFYFCFQQNYSVFTLEWSGNEKNRGWRMLESNNTYDNFRETYHCIFKPADVCKVVNFTRVAKPTVYVAVNSAVQLEPNKKYMFPRANKTEYFFEKDLHNLQAIERLIKAKFLYYMRPPQGTEVIFHRLSERKDLVDGYINVMLKEQLTSIYEREFSVSYPLHFEDYVIISNKRGPATPLEKIAKFYGRVTLISLVLLSALTLMVIRFKTHSVIALALFNVLRLLINTTITVSINTLPLRIFFSMIFLYFLIIHSTFSGHLAKFLTVDAYFDTIETLEDLSRTEIKKILIVDRNFEGIFFRTGVYDKLSSVSNNDECIKKMYNISHAVCIGVRSLSEEFIYDHGLDDELHVSRKKLWTMPSHFLYRRRLYWRKKFDWALMFLSETKIYNWSIDRRRDDIRKYFIEQQKNAHTGYRSILFKDLKFAFVFLVGGSGLGFVSFLFELFIYQMKYRMSRVTRIRVGPSRKKRNVNN